MLAMVALTGTIIIAVVIIGFLCQFLFLNHQKERSDADECVLILSHTINSKDRVGQMNTAVERAREIVYASRKAHNELVQDESDPALEDFSRLLIEEARSGAQLVESGRKILSEQIVQDLSQSAKEYKKKLALKGGSKVGPVNISPAILTRVELGLPRRVFANVTATDAFDQLLKDDRQSGYVSNSGLAYVGGINAKLPSPDNDLDFKLTPLASAIGARTSPPRLIGNSIFDARAVILNNKDESAALTQIPSAVCVKLEMPVATNAFSALSSNMQVTASAAAGGALRAPDEPDRERP